jgi:hypothetical protein
MASETSSEDERSVIAESLLTCEDAAIYIAVMLRAQISSRIGIEQDQRDSLLMRFAQCNPNVCCSNYLGEPIFYGGRAQR